MNSEVDSKWRTLYVSAVLGGGRGFDDIKEGIQRLARLVSEFEDASSCDGPSEEAAVDVTFHVPGTIWPVDFDGMRTGRWVSAKRLLVVQIAVPESVSGDPEAVNEFLARSLRDAVELAGGYLKRRKLELSVDRARLVAEKAARSLVS